MGPIIGRALAAGASALAKRAAEKASKKASKKADDAVDPDKYKVRNPDYEGDKPRRSPGYREFETTSPKLSDEYKKGGSVGSASRRADGIAQRGKTRGTLI